jgi:CDP-glycerol glycerophosphotransferase (TagB/SpsB family)
VDFDELVNEPSQAKYRSTRSMPAQKSIHDIEYRLVQVLKSGLPNKKEQIRILVAPTYSESSAGEEVLVNWISEVGKIAKQNNWKIDIALHPGAKPRVAKLIKRKTRNASLVAGMETSRLHNYSAVVTDFSGIAHDCLLLNIPIVSVWLDLAHYQELCPVLTDEDQVAASYVVRSLSELGEQISQAVNADPLASVRITYANSVLSQLGAEPGASTKTAVLAALDFES